MHDDGAEQANENDIFSCRHFRVTLKIFLMYHALKAQVVDDRYLGKQEKGERNHDGFTVFMDSLVKDPSLVIILVYSKTH